DLHGLARGKGRIVSCEPYSNPGLQGRLKQRKNCNGFTAEENHLEEWIAREPSALFAGTPVLLLVSQNYVHLRQKIDLLFMDARCRLYPVELKITRAAKSGGVVPYDLYERQMKPYLHYLEQASSLSGINPRYSEFSKLFNGVSSIILE